MGRQRSLKISKKLAAQKEQKEATRKAGKMNYLPAVLLFSIGFLTFLAYFRSLHGKLVLDDIVHITPSKLENITHYFSLSWRSIARLSFALNYYLSGMNLVAFKITNIIFHMFSVLLVFYLTHMTLNLPSVRDKYRRPEDNRTPLFIALLTATLFSLHPIQTSAVSYITQRMAIMAGMFSFAGIILYVKGAVNTGKKSFCFYAISVLVFILAIFSKENAVMVLPALMVYDFVFLSSFRWSEFRKRFVPVAILGVISGSAVAYYLHAGGIIGKVVEIFLNPYKPLGDIHWAGVDIHWTPVELILTELRVVSRYIFLILVPLPSYMVFDYSNAYPISKDLFHPITTLFSFCFLASIFFFSLRYIKKFPLISFGIIWYLITISLESFIAIGLDPYFEHRNYLPSYGLFLALSSLLIYVDKPGIRIKKEVIVLIVALLLFVLTFTRNGVWRERTLLWQDVVKKAPNSARGHFSLGLAYESDGLLDKAIEEYRTALTLRPDYAEARYGLGLSYQSEGLLDKAIEEYRTALTLRPDYAEARYGLGNAYMAEGLLDKAIEQYRTALILTPDAIQVHYNLGLAFSRKGVWDQAIEQYLIVIKSDPKRAQAHENLGVAYAEKGLVDKAIEYFKIALTLNPQDPNYLDNFSKAYQMRKSGGKTE